MSEESTGAVLEMELRNRILQLSRLTDAQASTITCAIDTNIKLLGYIDTLESRLATVDGNLQSSEQQCRELQDALAAARETTNAIEQFYVVGEIHDQHPSVKANHYVHSFIADQGLRRFRNGAKVYVKLSDEVKP